MSSRPFTVKAEAQDAMSADEKNAYQEMVRADMIAQDVLQTIKDDFGVDAFNQLSTYFEVCLPFGEGDNGFAIFWISCLVGFSCTDGKASKSSKLNAYAVF